MKYDEQYPPLQCIMTESTCYKRSTKLSIIRGVLWHSTGANNPNLKRYVQPSDNDKNRDALLSVLGVNAAKNDWNHIYNEAGVNAWIGKLSNGTVSTVQTLPWDMRPWGCGSGKRGSCNNGWIQFEICEDSLGNQDYFNRVYREACELTAYLCRMYNIDPHGSSVINGVVVPNILCHQDSYRLGLGSNHADIYHWFNKYGKNMQDVRDDVAALLAESEAKEDEDMTEERVKELALEAFQEYRDSLRDNTAGSWSKEDRAWAVSTGLINGTGNDANGKPNYAWRDLLTREQAAALFHRLAKYLGKE